jgi:hypothetical protein
MAQGEMATASTSTESEYSGRRWQGGNGSSVIIVAVTNLQFEDMQRYIPDPRIRARVLSPQRSFQNSY